MPVGRRGDETRPGEPRPLTVKYHPAAVEEWIEAARYYDSREAGLGDRFITAVDAAVATLQRMPFLGSLDAHGRRRWLIGRFPYLVIYRIKESNLYILAVAHTSRLPDYWEPRDFSDA